MPTEPIFDLAKLEYGLVQQQIDKYDEVGYKIKAWTVTLWVTLFGWALQFGRPQLLLLNIFAVLVFYFLDAVNKNFRQDYKARRTLVAAALEQFGRTGTWPQDFRTPVNPEHRWADVAKQVGEAHLFLVYVPLSAISLAVYCLQKS
jgi:hypothetical protein